MNYDIYIYLISTLFASFALSGINYEKFMKSNPHLTVSDFNMIMFNELSGILN